MFMNVTRLGKAVSDRTRVNRLRNPDAVRWRRMIGGSVLGVAVVRPRIEPVRVCRGGRCQFIRGAASQAVRASSLSATRAPASVRISSSALCRKEASESFGAARVEPYPRRRTFSGRARGHGPRVWRGRTRRSLERESDGPDEDTALVGKLEIVGVVQL